MWGLDVETLVKVGLVALFLLFGLLKLILETYLKAASQRKAGDSASGRRGAAPGNLRDILAEIRGEARSPPGTGEGATSASEPVLLEVDSNEGRRKSDLPSTELLPDFLREDESETVESPPVKPALSTHTSPPPPRPRGQRRKEVSEKMAGPGSVHEHLEALDRDDLATLARRRLESAMERQRMGAQTTRSGFKRVGLGPSKAFPRGLLLRDAILAQILLEPPRCRRRSPLRTPGSRAL